MNEQNSEPDTTPQLTNEQGSDPWRFVYPNIADFNFNYYILLRNAAQTGIAKNKSQNLKIAIVGAGIAGLVAAHELFRCGYKNIDIYEASDRIGGRTWSKPVERHKTTYELGAMRVPFFEDPKGTNSALAHYYQKFDIRSQPFPEHGSVKTGIWMNDGFGPKREYKKRKLDIWHKSDSVQEDKWRKLPEALQKVQSKWDRFKKMTTAIFREKYDGSSQEWESFWHSFAGHYWKMNFRELVFTPSIPKYEPSNLGWFGGLDLDPIEARLLYTIGIGDGGWGAFYDISALWIIRTILFGFGNKLQLIQGKFTDHKFALGPYKGVPVYDNLKNLILKCCSNGAMEPL